MTRSTFRVTFFLKRTALKKNGKMPIMARISINAQRAHFSTKLEIEPEKWVTHQNRVSGRDKEANETNVTLDETRAIISNIYQNLAHQNSNVTAVHVKNRFLGIDDRSNSLLDLFAQHNEDVEKRIGIDATMSTYKKYELSKRRVEEFLQQRYNRSDIPLRDLHPRFVKEYELFLVTKCNLSNNVAAKMIMFLKKIVTMAFNYGIIPSNPFANFHMKKTKVERGFLTKEELDLIMSKRIDIVRLDIVRDTFLFCCYTGLSYIDIRNLTRAHLRNTSDGNMWISTHRQKTGMKVDIMLLDIPKMLINKYLGRTTNDSLLPVLSNQKSNSYLKELADICGINKNLTFHQSRHTFATTVTLSNGVPIETVSRLLGHSSIKTTQIYARITTEKINNDMKQLEIKLGNVASNYNG